MWRYFTSIKTDQSIDRLSWFEWLIDWFLMVLIDFMKTFSSPPLKGNFWWKRNQRGQSRRHTLPAPRWPHYLWCHTPDPVTCPCTPRWWHRSPSASDLSGGWWLSWRSTWAGEWMPPGTRSTCTWSCAQRLIMMVTWRVVMRIDEWEGERERRKTC